MLVKASLGLLVVLIFCSALWAAPATGIVSHSPLPNAVRVSPHNNIVIRYEAPLEERSLQDRSVLDVLGSRSGLHAGQTTLLDGGKTMIFEPDRPFALGERVTIRTRPGLRTMAGEPAAEVLFSFETSRVDPQKQENRSRVQSADCVLEPQWSGDAPPVRLEPTPSIATLPADLPALSLLLANAPEPGKVFVTPFSLSSPFGHLVIVDNQGIPVFYRRADRPVYDFKKHDNGLVTYAQWGKFYYALDSKYAVVDSFAAGNGYALTDLHDILLLDNGHTFLMAKDPQPVRMDSVVVGGHPDAIVTGLILQELDVNRNVVFQWRSWDHFDITDGSVSNYVSMTDSLIDYVHANAVEIDGDGNILLSSRHMNEITKIDRQTGAILWRLAPNGANNDFTMVNDPRGFSHQHDIRRLANGNIQLFDNGNFLDPQYSRVVEYELDEINKVATLVSEYRDTPDIFAVAMGGAQRRASGGTMIGWGLVPGAPHVTDLHADGTKAFELGFDPGYFTYRAFRFDWESTLFAASADTLDFGHLAVGASATLPVFVHNTSTSEVTITSLVTTDDEFTTSGALPLVIAPGDSAEVSVHYDPAWTSNAVAHLYVRSETTTELVAETVVLVGVAGTVTAVTEGSETPRRFRLHTSTPNPFNPATTIRYDVSLRTHVSLEIFDARGRQVATLVDGLQEPGQYEARWNAPDIASGIYLCRMMAGPFVATQKLTVLR